MTRQEAIRQLETIKHTIQIDSHAFPTRTGDRQVEAIDKAVEALKYMDAMIDDKR